MVSLLLTFKEYTASGVLSFSMHHFHVSKYNYVSKYIISEHKFALEHFRRNKQKMSAGEKTTEEKQTILLESTQRLK